MSREARVGLMFAVSLIILGVTLYFMGSFQETLGYKIRFSKVFGLEIDSPVQFNGVPIGRVTKIVLSEETPTDQGVPIIVSIAVHRSVRNHIRTTTEADIKSVGILGDKSILLITKDYGTAVLEEGDFIKPSSKMLDVEKLLAQGTDVVADITEVTEDLRKILDQMANENGLIPRLITDTKLADDLHQIVARASSYLETDDNLMAMLFKDPALAKELRTELTSITSNLTAITGKIRNGEGLVPALMTDAAYKDEIKGKIDHLLDSATTLIASLSNEKGLLYRLTQDEAYGERVAQNLDKASFHLASILEKVDKGDGSASLLINDPSLYQGIYEVVYGLQHSGVSKWYIQKKQRKGEKLNSKQEEESQ